MPEFELENLPSMESLETDNTSGQNAKEVGNLAQNAIKVWAFLEQRGYSSGPMGELIDPDGNLVEGLILDVYRDLKKQEDSKS